MPLTFGFQVIKVHPMTLLLYCIVYIFLTTLILSTISSNSRMIRCKEDIFERFILDVLKP